MAIPTTARNFGSMFMGVEHFRVLTEHEQNEKNRREWVEKCHERRKDESVITIV